MPPGVVVSWSLSAWTVSGVSRPADRRPPEPLFTGGGRMGEVMASWDWSATPVGAAQQWPGPLRTAVGIVLRSQFPMFLAWGPELRLFYNDAYLPILGVKHPAALGEPFERTWADVWPVVGPMARNVLRGEASYVEDLLLIMQRAGFEEETYFTFSYSPLHGEGGAVAGLFCAVTETTGRVVGERRLRLLSELGDITAVTAPTVTDAVTAALETLERARVDVPFASIYLLDSDGERARRCGFYGMVDDPRVVPELLDRDTHPDAPLWQLLDTGRPQVRSGLSRDHPGMFAPLGAPMPDRAPDCMITVALTGGGGRPVGMLFAGVSPFRALDDEYRRFVDLVAGGVSTAITDARMLQDQLRRAEELAELDRAKTEFFTGVSHELRTPLALIAGPAEDGLADGDHPLPDTQRTRMEVIARNSRRLRRLVDTLLEFARLEARRLVPAPKAVDLAALTRGVAESFAPAIDRAGLGFHVDCPPLTSAVAVDVDMWEKIVLNLLSNAVKYTLTGDVSVQLRPGREGGVELAVSDSGVGIPAADQPLLFQRFHRVRGAAGRSVEGSGIGLALVAELTALHQGTVDVDSTPGRGSRFTVTLPPAVLTGAPSVPAHATPTAELYREEALGWIGPAVRAHPGRCLPPAPPGRRQVLWCWWSRTTGTCAGS